MSLGLDKEERETKEEGRSTNFTQDENGKITPGRKRDPTPDSTIQAPTKQTSQTPNANLQEALLLSKQLKPKKTQKREQRG